MGKDERSPSGLVGSLLVESMRVESMRVGSMLVGLTAVLGMVLVLLAGSVQAEDSAAGSVDIRFAGTLINYTEGSRPGAASYWMVHVEEVSEGPVPCSDTIKVVVYQATPPPWGSVDPDLAEGDLVAVWGRYLADDSGCQVTLQGSESYYVRRYVEPATCAGLPHSFKPCKADVDMIQAGSQTSLALGIPAFPWKGAVSANRFDAVKDQDPCCKSGSGLYDVELIGGGDQSGMTAGFASSRNSVLVEGSSV